MRCVVELMSPVEHTVVATQPLSEAAGLLRGSDAALLVVDSAGRTVGVLTDEDLAAAAAEHPDAWAQSRCADACFGGLDFLRAEQSVEVVLWRYRTEGVRPLAVLNGSKPVGILYPDRVFLWCLEQSHADFTEIITATAPARATVTAMSVVSHDQPSDMSRVSMRESSPIQHASPMVSGAGILDAIPTLGASKMKNAPKDWIRPGSDGGGTDAYATW